MALPENREPVRQIAARFESVGLKPALFRVCPNANPKQGGAEPRCEQSLTDAGTPSPNL
jgi:hypothetical protein